MRNLKTFESFEYTNELNSEENILYSLVSGGCRNTKDSHGSISRRFIPSATKRICGQIEGYIDEQVKKKIQSENSDDFIVISKEKFEKMSSALEKRNKTIQDLINKLKESGQL